MSTAQDVGQQPRAVSDYLRRHSSAISATALAVLLTLLTLWLWSGASQLGIQLSRASFDTSLRLAQPFSPSLTNSPVAVVYLDFQSYRRERQDPYLPWDRAIHARLVERLTRAGARAIVFDIVFSDPGPDPVADQAFADALRAGCPVVLGAELTTSSRARDATSGLRQLALQLPDPRLRNAAPAWGIAHSRIDDDFVVRQHFVGYPDESQPSLVWATAKLLDLPVVRNQGFRGLEPWIRYYAPPFELPHVSYTDALSEETVPDDFFRNRIIFVGARPMTSLFPERRDETRSPLVTSGDRELFHPGVEVHAIQLLNLIREDWLVQWPALWEGLLLLTMGVLAAIMVIRLRPWIGAAVISTLFLITLAAAVLAVQNGTWFPWILVGGVQLPAAFLGGVIHHSLDWFIQRRHLEAVRRQAERKIREQAKLIDKARDAILLIDLEGGLTYANPGALALYGGSLEELRHAHNGGLSLTPSRSALHTARTATIRRGEWVGELSQRTTAGEGLVVESRWTLIRDDNDTPRAILIINTDVTEKKRIEAQLLRTQRQDTIGSLASGMAHDLNNALAPILMGLQLLERRSPDAETLRLLTQMETNTHRCAALVRQVLLFSRGHEGMREFLNLGSLIKEVADLLRETLPPNIRLNRFLPDDLWMVHADLTQLHQVLLNLCVNARDAMPGGGALTLAADNVDLSQEEALKIPSAQPGSYVMLLVSDTGSGIPPALRARVFEPFFTTKPEGKGTGLGLSTVASVVKNHGGYLKLESDPKTGTTFEIYLPRATEPKILPSESAPTSAPRGKGELVLVIDDELSIRDMLTEALKEQGYRTLTAANGIEALSLAHRHPAGLGLALVDHLMPGPAGLEIVQQLRQHRPGLPIILVSGQPSLPLTENGVDRERLGVLEKPFRLETLFTLIHEMLQPREPQHGRTGMDL